jgi:hypothetical protein
MFVMREIAHLGAANAQIGKKLINFIRSVR